MSFLALLLAFQIHHQDGAHFQIDQQSLQESEGRKIQRLKAHGPQSELDLTIMGPLTKPQFENYLKLELTAFQHLYSEAITPYPGKISNRSVCPEKFRPSHQDRQVFSQRTQVWLAKANSRKNFGACNTAEAAFEGALAIVHLPTGYAVKAVSYAKTQNEAVKALAGFSYAPVTQ